MAITAGYSFVDGEQTQMAKKLNLAFSGATAFNGTVGATTPSTGAFTTFIAGNQGNALQVGLNPSSGPITPTMQFIGSNYPTAAFGLFQYQNATPQSSSLLFHKSRGAVGTFTTVANGDRIAIINFNGADGTQWVNGASIEAVVTAAVSAGVVPTSLRFLSSGVTILTVAPAGISVVGSLTLGNAYVAGVVAATGTIVIKDSTGTAYRVSCAV